MGHETFLARSHSRVKTCYLLMPKFVEAETNFRVSGHRIYSDSSGTSPERFWQESGALEAAR